MFAEGNDKHLTFDDFLDMMSVFCEEATRDVKATYAFRIYGNHLFLFILRIYLYKL